MAGWDSAGLDKSGFVLKKAEVMPSWNSRYLQADPMNVRLIYFKDRPKTQSEYEKNRGELILTDCTVSVDASCNDDQYRFLVTNRDRSSTFHLEVDDNWERQEWLRVIRLISALGITKESVIREEKMMDNADTFKYACEKLLEHLDEQASNSRKSLDLIAGQKWAAKERLIELQNEMRGKNDELRVKQNEMKSQENEYRDELSRLNQALYLLQQQVRKSNELQQRIVQIFGRGSTSVSSSKKQGQSGKQETNGAAGAADMSKKAILEKAHRAVQLCQHLMQSARSGRPPLLAREKSDPMREDGGSKANNAGSAMDDAMNASKVARARSMSDVATPRAAMFEEEMALYIMEFFPDTFTSYSDPHGRAPTQEKIDYSNENNNVIRVFNLYQKYYVNVHLPREMELIKIRTKCEQKYHSLRFVGNQKELARRQEDEIEWIMSEMQRAIDRLSREGVVIDEAAEHAAAMAKSARAGRKSKKEKKTKKKGDNDDGDGSPPEDPAAQAGRNRGSSAMLPVLTHRQTWSEASETIFQLNVARKQQYRATKDLEESLKSRELVKSWYEEKIAI